MQSRKCNNLNEYHIPSLGHFKPFIQMFAENINLPCSLNTPQQIELVIQGFLRAWNQRGTSARGSSFVRNGYYSKLY